MQVIKRPSYLPEDFPTNRIPEGLFHEERFWNVDPSLVLKQDSAAMLLETQRYTERHFRRVLNSAGFNPEIENKGRLTGHNTRVAILSLLIADGMEDQGVDFPIDKSVLAPAALWHDIGKFDQQVHDSIFPSNKRIAPDDPAREIIKTHPKKGAEIVANLRHILAERKRGEIADVIYCHHERYDGRGYYQVENDDIPNEAWVVMVADPTDVMLGTRGYARQKTLGEVLADLTVNSGSQFHPTIADSAIKTFTKSEKPIRHIGRYNHSF